MRLQLALALLLASPALPEAARGNAVCVQNGGHHRLLFAAEARPGARRVAELDPGGRLCAEASAPGATGVVSVFEHADEMEGCSRLVAVGQTEILLRYVDFDRCA